VVLKLLNKFYQAGIPIEAGTDNFAGFALDRELELDVQAGIPAPQTLQLATFGAARIMHMDDRLGPWRQANSPTLYWSTVIQLAT